MLRLTKRADYGLIALKHLADRQHQGSASAKEIAACYGMPLTLLSKVLQTLARNGFLTSEHGTRGGYRLARDPRKISVLDVIRAIDGSTILTSCFPKHGACDQSDRCTVREPLRRIYTRILDLLAGITITDMSERGMGKAKGGRGQRKRPDRLCGSGERVLALKE